MKSPNSHSFVDGFTHRAVTYDQLVGRIQSAYGLAEGEADRQLRNWERSLAAEAEQVELLLDDDEASEINGRG